MATTPDTESHIVYAHLFSRSEVKADTELDHDVGPSDA